VKGVASRTGVPIMVTSQFNKDVKMSATTADQTAAAFTDSIMHDADFVFAMFRTSSMKLLKEMLVRSLKVREGVELNELFLKWDIDAGNFQEISATTMSGSAVADPVIDDEVDMASAYSYVG